MLFTALSDAAAINPESAPELTSALFTQPQASLAEIAAVKILLAHDAKMGAVGNRTMASLYDLIPSYKLDKRFQRKIGDWNQARIVAMPNNIVQHWLNGFKVLEYERKSNIFNALVARSKYEKYVKEL